mgnify:CR=1 FL=1
MTRFNKNVNTFCSSILISKIVIQILVHCYIRVFSSNSLNVYPGMLFSSFLLDSKRNDWRKKKIEHQWFYNTTIQEIRMTVCAYKEWFKWNIYMYIKKICSMHNKMAALFNRFVCRIDYIDRSILLYDFRENEIWHHHYRFIMIRLHDSRL